MHGGDLVIYHEGEGESIFVALTTTSLLPFWVVPLFPSWGLIQLPKSTFLVGAWVEFLHSVVNSLRAGPKPYYSLGPPAQ